MEEEKNAESSQSIETADLDLRRYRLILEYDGTDFFGWQVQPEQRTVQGVLEETLARFYGVEIRVHGSGRTDTGVHALGQVAHFDAVDKYAPAVINNGLNALLPADVRVLEVHLVPEDFHARYSARWRWYRYRIYTRQRALGRQFGWWQQHELDWEILTRCAATLPGEHDFSSFSKSDPPVEDRRCYVYAAHWDFDEDEWLFHIVANRFLRHMVRQLVGVMVDVARGRFTTEQFVEMLNNPGKTYSIFTAPAGGLCLMKVGYGTFPMMDEDHKNVCGFPFKINPETPEKS